MDDIILLKTDDSENYTLYSKDEISIINLNSMSIDDWVECLICFVSNDFTHHYSVNSNFYKLKELGYKFTWEFVTKVIQHERFLKDEYFYLISEILHDMEGLEVKIVDDIEKVFINPQTKESITLINFPINPELYFDDVEIKGEN